MRSKGTAAVAACMAAVLLALAFILPEWLSAVHDRQLLDSPSIQLQDEEQEGFAESIQLTVAEKVMLLRSGEVNVMQLGQEEVEGVYASVLPEGWEFTLNVSVDKPVLPEMKASTDEEITSYLAELNQTWEERLEAVQTEIRSLQAVGGLPDLWNEEDETRGAALWTLKTVLIQSLKLLHPYMPFVTEEIFCNLQEEEESIMISSWPEYRKEWNFAAEEQEVETIKEAVRAIRNVRTSMNVPPSRKAKVYVVSQEEKILEIFRHSKVFFATLGFASEVCIQSDKNQIAEDAVSAVISQATIYMPFAELVDIAKELERLQKEKERLTKELARVNGMLSNERFVSKAPEAKINEEKAKQEKYTQMMAQVEERLAQLQQKA